MKTIEAFYHSEGMWRLETEDANFAIPQSEWYEFRDSLVAAYESENWQEVSDILGKYLIND